MLKKLMMVTAITVGLSSIQDVHAKTADGSYEFGDFILKPLARTFIKAADSAVKAIKKDISVIKSSVNVDTKLFPAIDSLRDNMEITKEAAKVADQKADALRTQLEALLKKAKATSSWKPGDKKKLYDQYDAYVVEYNKFADQSKIVDQKLRLMHDSYETIVKSVTADVDAGRMVDEKKLVAAANNFVNIRENAKGVIQAQHDLATEISRQITQGKLDKVKLGKFSAALDAKAKNARLGFAKYK